MEETWKSICEVLYGRVEWISKRGFQEPGNGVVANQREGKMSSIR